MLGTISGGVSLKQELDPPLLAKPETHDRTKADERLKI
jgi:hypothetical protein